MTRKSDHYYTREERKWMIITTLAIGLEKHEEYWLSTNEIAVALKMAKSTHLKDMIAELVIEERLICRLGERAGWQSVYEFTLKPGSYTPRSKRTIAIKSKGQQVGQMKLF